MHENNFIAQVRESLFAYQEIEKDNKTQTARVITPSYNNILNYIKFDNLLQTIADIKMSVNNKKKI